ncbi:uncharacterized protein LOC101857845 [Aplysia californica]|uniref:Uncharacterized protein LOC101857845 n=1 Tax=Aplysia californica TaxID=6500 RepID=A0ABM1AD31_APLCA|nr:uncharacterized protein LOC101857845 [Aplysia californica]
MLPRSLRKRCGNKIFVGPLVIVALLWGYFAFHPKVKTPRQKSWWGSSPLVKMKGREIIFENGTNGKFRPLARNGADVAPSHQAVINSNGIHVGKKVVENSKSLSLMTTMVSTDLNDATPEKAPPINDVTDRTNTRGNLKEESTKNPFISTTKASQNTLKTSTETNVVSAQSSESVRSATILIRNNKNNTAPEIRANSKGKQTTRYIVYLCDGTVYCYGFGDRQRAISGLYYLAQVTRRKLLLKMTSPSPLTDFYSPAEYDWVVSDEELRGKSFLKIRMFGPREAKAAVIDESFNSRYPQDIVYFETNHNFYDTLKKIPAFQKQLGHPQRWRVHAEAWLKLMQPTRELRSALNNQLIKIVRAQREEQKAFANFDTRTCNKSCISTVQASNGSQINVDSGNSRTCKDGNIGGIQTRNENGTTSDTRTPTNHNKNETEAVTEELSTSDLCRFPPPQVKNTIPKDKIRQLSGHQVVNLGLVCVHVRMGKSETLNRDGGGARNKPEYLPALWNFLRTYVNKGHHVYIATDSQKVRDLALSGFGHRIHTSTTKITHSSLPEKNTSVAREGFKLALMEQLLLSTSCQVLVISKSGLSLRAAMVRRALQGEGGLYLFHDGAVSAWSSYHLF